MASDRQATNAPSGPETEGALLEFLQGLSPVLAIGGVIALLAAGVVQLIFADLTLYALIVTGIGVVLLLAATVLSFDAVKEALIGRRGRYGLNTIIMVSAFLGLAVVANFVASQYARRFDVTTGRQFTLARGTLASLDSLKQDVQITGFFAPDVNSLDAALKGEAEDLIAAYRRVTPRIQYRSIDYQLQPQALARYGFDRSPPVLVFETAERTQPVFSEVSEAGVPQFTEQDLTSALLVVTGAKLKTVYFTAGHGERDIADTADLSAGYGLIRRLVEGDNYRVQLLDLTTANAVPADANVLVVAGPKTPFLPGEVQVLDAYLQRPGKALFLLDQDTPDSLLGLLTKWGIAVDKGIATDPNRFVQPNPTDVVPNLNQLHRVAANLNAVFLPSAVALGPASDKLPETLSIVPFAQTSAASWLETDPAQNPPQFDASRDQRGPLFVGLSVVAVAPPEGEGAGSIDENNPAQLVLIGDTDFAANANRGLNNPQLFLNAVNWLAEQEQLIDIAPKPTGLRRLILSPEAAAWIQWSSPLLLPALILALGALNWWRRR